VEEIRFHTTDVNSTVPLPPITTRAVVKEVEDEEGSERVTVLMITFPADETEMSGEARLLGRDELYWMERDEMSIVPVVIAKNEASVDSSG
jgi:hypothetical protein